MKESDSADPQTKSGLLLGSEPLEDIRHRRAYKMSADDDSDGKDADGDSGDDDATDSDKTDSDQTDKGDRGAGSPDSDGRD